MLCKKAESGKDISWALLPAYRALEDGHSNVRKNAAAALTIHYVRCDDWEPVKTFLSSKDWVIKTGSADALGVAIRVFATDISPAKNELFLLLGNAREEVRESAAKTLTEQYIVTNYCNSAEELANHKDVVVRKAVADTFRIYSREDRIRKSFEPCLLKMLDDEEPVIRGSAAEAITRFYFHKNAWENIEAVINHVRFDVREIVSLAIGEVAEDLEKDDRSLTHIGINLVEQALQKRRRFEPVGTVNNALDHTIKLLQVMKVKSEGRILRAHGLSPKNAFVKKTAGKLPSC
ncbi:MAG: HEAT repeat domain-containing protein [Candidatus Micrarchaeota archaeon]